MRSVEPPKGSVRAPAASRKTRPECRPAAKSVETSEQASHVRAVEPEARGVVNHGLRWVAGLESDPPPSRVVYVEHDEKRWELHVFLGPLPDIPVPGPEDNPWLKKVLERRAEREARQE
jgi:hypothetical protein